MTSSCFPEKVRGFRTLTAVPRALAVGGGAGGGRVEDALDRPACARDGVVTDKRGLFVTGGITGGITGGADA